MPLPVQNRVNKLSNTEGAQSLIHKTEIYSTLFYMITWTFHASAARVFTKDKYEDADHLKLVCQLGWLTVRNLIRLDLEIFKYKSQNIVVAGTAGEFHSPTKMTHLCQTWPTVAWIRKHVPTYYLTWIRSELYAKIYCF